MNPTVLAALLIELTEEDCLDTLEDDVEIVKMMLNLKNKRNSIQDYYEQTVQSYTDEEFKCSFRISRNVFECLEEKFKNCSIFTSLDISKTTSAGKHLAVFLWMAGHEACSYRDLSDRFNLSLSTIHEIIVRCTLFLSNLSEEIIRWPSEEEMKVSAEVFKKKSSIPNICGFIDGTHIRFDPPAEKLAEYLNRKKFSSIQVQAICDHKLKFIDMFTGYPGSVHDSRVFKNSPIYFNLSEKCRGNRKKLKYYTIL